MWILILLFFICNPSAALIFLIPLVALSSHIEEKEKREKKKHDKFMAKKIQEIIDKTP